MGSRRLLTNRPCYKSGPNQSCDNLRQAHSRPAKRPARRLRCLIAKQKSGTKTVENLLKLAVSSKSQVDVQYVAPDGERLSITVKPKQARAALGVLQQTKKSTAQRIPASRDAFLRIAQSGDSAALEKIIEAVVDRRDRELLQTLLEVSDRQRLYTVAEKLREAIKRIDGSGNEQPLLTSS